jgi:hypothetical protein
MDSGFFHDSRAPWIISDITSVTLSTTDKALYPAANFPVLGGNYWWAGKKLRVDLIGRITTAATPGNGTFTVYWGTGADANGTLILTSKANALIASQTNLTWRAQIDVHCRAVGSGTSGSLFASGLFLFDEAVMAAKQLGPASAPAAVGVDTTAANIISVQYKRSGSTVETMQVHDIIVSALN